MSDLTPEHGGRFVEIALPVPLRQTFTYGLPDHVKKAVVVGARVTVPLGKRILTGYVLDVFDSLPDDADVDPKKIRNINQVLDEEEEIAMKEFAKFEEKLRQQKGPDATPSTVGKGSLDFAE